MLDHKLDEKESHWLEVDETFLSNLITSITSNQNLYRKLRLTAECGTNVTLTIEDIPLYIDTLKQKFNVEVITENSQSKTDIYYIEKLPTYFQTGFSSIGFVGKKTKSIIFQGSGPGKLKSIVSSVMGFQKNDGDSYPIHASIFSYDGKGIAIIGGRGAGKTSSIHKMIERANENHIEILCDDWAFVEQAQSLLVARSFDKTISFTNKEIDELGLDHLKDNLHNLKKGSVKPNVFFNAFNNVEHISIDLLIGVPPIDRKVSILAEATALQMSEHIIRSAYHYPYCNSKFVSEHKAFWSNSLKGKKLFFCNNITENLFDLIENET